MGRDCVLAATAVSASLSESEKRAALTLAASLDVPHHFLRTHEMANPNYASNPVNRCFFCKDELFRRLAPLAQQKGMTLVDGLTASDRADVRPGRQAARAWSVAHPLDEADLFKSDIRVLSRWMRLPTWNKPASPCLSSRIPYGTPVTEETLRRIERAEAVLRREGFETVRVRHYGARARIEVLKKNLPQLLEIPQWTRIREQFQRLGYTQVEADPRGFASGRLNETAARFSSGSDAHAFEKK